MRPEDVVHEKQSSSWWSGTETMWCGVTADTDVITSTWFRSIDCPGCLAAMKKAGKR